jgi:hypothetical protein
MSEIKKHKVTLTRQVLITYEAEFIEEGNYEDIELFLKDTTYEEIEEGIERKLKWKIKDEDLQESWEEISEIL